MTEGSGPKSGPAHEFAETAEAIGRDFFSRWRGALNAIARAAMGVARNLPSVVRRWWQQWARVARYHTHPAASWEPGQERVRETAAAVGLRAFIAGVVLGGYLIGVARHTPLPGVADIATEVLWAGVRFIIVGLLLPRGVVDRARLSTAFLAGLLPYAFALTPSLSLAALVASGCLTWRGLEAARVRIPDVNRVIAWSFGGQLGVVLFSWFARAVVALLAMR